MSEAKFTPGPWTAINTNDGWQIAQRDKPGYFFSERRIGCRVDADEMVANARLIAAAPDLYEALTKLVRLWDEDQIHPANPSGIDISGFVEARAALAKASAP